MADQAAPSGHVEAPRIQALGRNLVLQLNVVIRSVRLYETSNRTLTSAFENLREAINALWLEMSGVVRLQFVEDVVYLNEHRLRITAGIIDHLDALRDELVIRGVGGLAFLRETTAEQLKTFFGTFAAPVETKEEAAEIRRAILDLGDVGIEMLEQQKLLDQAEYESMRISRVHFSLQAYARAVVAGKEYVEALRRGEDPMSGRLHLTRVVQDLIDIATERVNLLIKIPALKRIAEASGKGDPTGYAASHAANTAVYAILIGKVLGIDRLTLLDLGTSALLADVGFALLSPDLTERDVEISAEERGQVLGAMSDAVQSMITRGRVTAAMQKRLVVAFEHHAPYRSPGTGELLGCHVFSRIVAVADAFDALTTERPWRPALTASAALDTLQAEADTRFDPVVVRVLSSLLGAHAHAQEARGE